MLYLTRFAGLTSTTFSGMSPTRLCNFQVTTVKKPTVRVCTLLNKNNLHFDGTSDQTPRYFWYHRMLEDLHATHIAPHRR